MLRPRYLPGTRYGHNYASLRQPVKLINEDWRAHGLWPPDYRLTIYRPVLFKLSGTVFHRERVTENPRRLRSTLRGLLTSLCVRPKLSGALRGLPLTFPRAVQVETVMKHCPHCGRTYQDGPRFCLADGALLSLRDPYHLVGRTLAAKYRLDALVGVGGMGAVYQAYHLGLDRRVAFKILQPNLTLGNARTLDLFEREARLAGRLVHENIVLVLDAGRTSEEIAYIAMEWLEGRTLEAELAQRGPLSFPETAELLRQLAAALAAAHAERIIHRDLKPANIMLVEQPEGRARLKVLDFGIGKILTETAGAPVSSVMGTPHYASPEQFQLHGRIDARTDIYSLGVVLFQLLTGQLPFAATSVHELVQLHLTAAPPPLRQFRPEAPAALEQLLDRLLAKQPDARPAAVSEIPFLFERALQTLSPAPAEAPPAGAVPLRPSLEETELLPAPTGAHTNPVAANPARPTHPYAGAGAPADELPQPDPLSGAPAPLPPRAPSRLPHPAKRLRYLLLGSVLLLGVTLPLALFFFAPSVGLRLPERARPSAAPTRQAPPEPGQSPPPTPAWPNRPTAAGGAAAPGPTPTPPPLPERAVRTVKQRWVIQANDTVLDTQTGLLWMKKDFRVLEGRFVRGWAEAMAWARKMNRQQFAGYSDWRVASISEYKSIRDKTAYPQVFESQGEDCYWSRNEVSTWVASYIYMQGEHGGAAVSGAKLEGTNQPGVLFHGNFSVRLVRAGK
jgi:eukaryotic-like serine/threonine-protein kinase